MRLASRFGRYNSIRKDRPLTNPPCQGSCRL